jgi:hypothetical protein
LVEAGTVSPYISRQKMRKALIQPSGGFEWISALAVNLDVSAVREERVVIILWSVSRSARWIN